jgi:uncharacterized protein (DUF849 family)
VLPKLKTGRCTEGGRRRRQNEESTARSEHRYTVSVTFRLLRFTPGIALENSRPVPEANEMYGVETSGVEETSAGRECGALNPRKRAHLRLQRCYHWPVEISMAMTQKIIITCAVTGAIHTPSMSPYLPVTPEEIADAAIEAAKAGAAIVHVHARNPETGKPDHSLDAFKAFLPRIKEAVDVVINLTSGGAPYMKIEERIQPAVAFKPEIASLNMGSINFGLFPMLGRFKEFRYAWERDYLEGSRDLVFRNTFTDIEYALKKCADNGTRFEFECYDVGHLYNLAHFLNRGLVQPPLFVQTVFGILGGIGTHPEDVMHMKRTADRLFGEQYRWSVLGAGRNQLPIAAMAVGMGGNIRVGLEDSLWIGPGHSQRATQCKWTERARSSRVEDWKLPHRLTRARFCR